VSSTTPLLKLEVSTKRRKIITEYVNYEADLDNNINNIEKRFVQTTSLAAAIMVRNNVGESSFFPWYISSKKGTKK
jgi:hypothetical protein